MEKARLKEERERQMERKREEKVKIAAEKKQKIEAKKVDRARMQALQKQTSTTKKKRNLTRSCQRWPMSPFLWSGN